MTKDQNQRDFLFYHKQAMQLCRESDFISAIKYFTKAIEKNSKSADAHYNRALAFQKLENYDSAITDYTQAIMIAPEHFQAFNNRGLAFREQRQFKNAIDDFGKSISVNPNFSEGYWNKALTHLMIEDYETAWPLYEHRWKTPNFTSEKRCFSEPLWLGKDSLFGKTILLHSEQGLGDTIQFSRYVQKFDDLRCTVYLEVEKPLVRLMETLMPRGQVFEKGSKLPEFHYHCPLMSLPLAFQTKSDSIPCITPYLGVSSSRVQWWHKHLGPKTTPRVGIAWHGNPSHPKNHQRSMSLPDIINDLSPNFDWYSLQIQVSQEDEEILTRSGKITHFGELIGDFAETAALCSVLDAVICVDTSLAHLAGAIDRPVHLLLSYVADARWHDVRSDSPWYPSLHIHRQDKNKLWQKPLLAAQNKLIQSV